MKNLYLTIVLLFSSSIIFGGEIDHPDKLFASDTFTIRNKQLNDKEKEYIKVRDRNIDYLEKLRKSGKNDSLDKLDDNALSELELRLKEILKGSLFSGKGKINLETLQGYIGFGMLDGLSFQKDSMKFFYTTNNLFLEYFSKRKTVQIDNLSPENFEDICSRAFIEDARAYVYTNLKIDSPKNTYAYGMIVGISQGFRHVLPEYLYVFVSVDNYIYMIEKHLKAPINEIPSCKSIYDSIYLKAQKYYEIYRSSNLQDTAAINMNFKMEDKAAVEYCNCYRKMLKNDAQFEGIKKQLVNMFKYIDR